MKRSFNPITNQPETITALNLSGGISLGYTLFDGLRNFRQVQRAEISKLASQYRLVKMRDDIALFVANGYLQVLLNKANRSMAVFMSAMEYGSNRKPFSPCRTMSVLSLTLPARTGLPQAMASPITLEKPSYMAGRQKTSQLWNNGTTS